MTNPFDDNDNEEFEDGYDAVGEMDDIDPEVIAIGGRLKVEDVMGAAGIPDTGAGEAPSAYVDDFHRQLANINKADAAHPGNDLDAAIGAREARKSDLDSVAKPVRVNPPSLYKAILSAQTTISSGNTSDYVIQWTSDDDTEARDFSIALANTSASAGTWPQGQNAVASSYSYRSRAVLQWGSRAYMNTATVDVGRGVTLNLNASAIYVKFTMDAAQANYVAGSMQLSASLSPGLRATTQDVINSQYIDGLAGGGISSSIVIPNFAVTLCDVQRSDVTAGYTVAIRDTSGTNMEQVTIGGNTNFPRSIRLSGDSYSVELTNNAVGGSTNFVLIFGLSL